MARFNVQKNTPEAIDPGVAEWISASDLSGSGVIIDADLGTARPEGTIIRNPADGLLYVSTDPNIPSYVPVPSGGGGGGEVNTASNVNTSGVGVFKQKVGTDLEFRGVDAASSKVTVALDAVSNTIDVDVVDASTVQAGAIEIATQAEVDAGVSTTLAVTPATLASATTIPDEQVKVTGADTTPGFLADKLITATTGVAFTTLNPGADEDYRLDIDSASTTGQGLVEIATQAEVDAGVSTTLAVTPATLASAATVARDLQTAYDLGNTIVTAGATDISFTLTSGDFDVQGGGAVAFGSVTEVSSFRAFSDTVLTLQSRDTTLLDMQASDAADKTLTISAANAGAGAANLLVNVDDLTTITSQLGESSGLLRLTQSGLGGDSADLFIGTSDPSGVISARAASWFFRDTGSGAEAYQNISTGSGTTWARNVNAVNHKALRDLIHFIDDGPADGFLSGSYKQTFYDGALIIQEIWWEDNTLTQRIVQLDVTYTGSLPTTEVWQMFDTDGVTVLVTLTDAITYNGALETTRTRTWI